MMLTAALRSGFAGIALRSAFALSLALATAEPTHASAPDAPADRQVVAIGADLSVENGRTRLVITLSRSVQVTTFVLERPDRAVIEFPEVNFQFGDAGRRKLGLVASLRSGLFAHGRSRVVVDLAAPATVVGTSVTQAPLSGATLVTVEFARVDRDTFRKVASADRTDLALTTGSLPGAVGKDTRPAIAVDAGHGGTDPGAKAPNGTVEKDITFGFADALRARLTVTGRYRVIMIRDRDVFVSLDERVRRAREAGADLFLSIHADTISNPQIGGATVYTGSERASDVESATLAERENAADAAAGLAGPGGAVAVPDILQDLTLRETRGFSHLFSDMLLRNAGGPMRFSGHPRREAGFRVLRTHDLPSVLIELGYMSNARDLERMSSADWRGRTAGTMAEVVDRFFASRRAGGAAMSP